MINQWIKWINVFIIMIACGVFAATGIYWLNKPGGIETSFPASKELGLPKTAFELSSGVYDEISDPLLSLESEPPALQVPDLKGQLLFYGKNGRPDAQQNYTILHFALASNNKNIASIKPNEPLYLVFDRSINPGKYIFSPNNEKTSLWIQATLVDNEALVVVTFENEKGELIKEPKSNAQFCLPEKELSRTTGTSWEIASFRVDGTLLARQKARWYGPDRFLENHGGEDYSFVRGKQRIDFGENENIYSVFIKTGDILVWENDHWQVVEPGKDSLGRPLLIVKKVDERLMSFELWDVEGKSRVILNVLKTSEPWTMQNPQVLKAMFKFLGAKTRTQSVFEINGERMLLSPSDWLLLTPKGWIKLTNEKDIDDYVQRKLAGTLFIFEGVSRKDDRLAMQGTLYSPSRHEAQPVSLPLQAEKARSISKETQDAKERELKDAKEVADLIGEILAPLNRQENEVKQIAEIKKTSTAVRTKK